MERLNDVYNNINYDDNTVLIRVLNTILETNDEDSYYILSSIKYYIKLFEELSINVNRPQIKYIIEKVNHLENESSFTNFINLLNEIYQDDPTKITEYKYLFLISYCRTKFEILYDEHIRYTKPKYASYEAFGEPSWSVFLKAFKNNDYIYLK